MSKLSNINNKLCNFTLNLAEPINSDNPGLEHLFQISYCHFLLLLPDPYWNLPISRKCQELELSEIPAS